MPESESHNSGARLSSTTSMSGDPDRPVLGRETRESNLRMPHVPPAGLQFANSATGVCQIAPRRPIKYYVAPPGRIIDAHSLSKCCGLRGRTSTTEYPRPRPGTSSETPPRRGSRRGSRARRAPGCSLMAPTSGTPPCSRNQESGGLECVDSRTGSTVSVPLPGTLRSLTINLQD